MKRHYFYSLILNTSWYTLSIESLKELISKSKDESGKYKHSFPATFVFTGFCTETSSKDDAENNYKKGENLILCKEPNCMLIARREYFTEWQKTLFI